MVCGRSRLAHRVAYEIAFGHCPSGMVVMHKCDNRKCVNPRHLLLGTVGDNNRDRHEKGRSAGASHAGEANPMATYSSATVMAIYTASGTQAKIAKELGVPFHLVSAVKNGTAWASVTGAEVRRKYGDDGLTNGQRHLLQIMNGGALRTNVSIEDALRQCGWRYESSLYRAIHKLKRMGLVDASASWRSETATLRGSRV